MGCSRSWPPWLAARTWWPRRCCRCACNEANSRCCHLLTIVFLLCCWGPYRPTLLTACCSCLGFLVQAGISDTLRNLLATSSLLAAGTVSPGNVLRSAEQVGAACVVRVSCKGRWGAQVVCELHLLLICLRLPGCLTPQSYHPFLFNSWAT